MNDQGLLTHYLGDEVKQTGTRITICQEQYVEEITPKIRYDKAHAAGNPMGVNVRLGGDNTNK